MHKIQPLQIDRLVEGKTIVIFSFRQKILTNPLDDSAQLFSGRKLFFFFSKTLYLDVLHNYCIGLITELFVEISAVLAIIGIDV